MLLLRAANPSTVPKARQQHGIDDRGLAYATDVLAFKWPRRLCRKFNWSGRRSSIFIHAQRREVDRIVDLKRRLEDRLELSDALIQRECQALCFLRSPPLVLPSV